MNSKVRRRELYEFIKRNREVQVADLAKLMNVSCMTIRRDLAAMEMEGLVTRSYGKASLKNDSANEISFAERINENYDCKLKACREAVKLLDGVSSIFVDGSTTCYALSTLLPPGRALRVLTSNLSAAMYLRNMRNIEVIVPGGTLAKDQNTIDTQSAQFIPDSVFVEIAFFSCGGFSESGVVDSNLSGAYIRNYFRKTAQSVVLIADHTKYKKRGLYAVYNWTDLDYFITDEPPEESLLRHLRRHGVRARWSAPLREGVTPPHEKNGVSPSPD